MVYNSTLPLVISTQEFLISLISQRHSHSCCLQGRRLASVLAVLVFKTGNRREKKWILSYKFMFQTNHGSNLKKKTCKIRLAPHFFEQKTHMYQNHIALSKQLWIFGMFWFSAPHNRNIQPQLLWSADCTGILVAAVSHFSKPPEPTLEIYGINVVI